MAHPNGPQPSTEENVHAVVYYALVVGMLVSSILFLIGIASALAHPAYYPLTQRWVREHYSLSRVVHGVIGMDPMSLMMVATVVLILTPVSRVVVSIYAFIVDRDLKFVVVTSIVFVVMVITVVAGLLGLR